MKEDDIHQNKMVFKYENKYCLNGLVSVMTGFRNEPGKSFVDDAIQKIGIMEHLDLSRIHQSYCEHRDFERMRQEAIRYMESLRRFKSNGR